MSRVVKIGLVLTTWNSKSGAQEWYIAILGLQVFEMIFFHFQFLTPPNILQPCTKLCNKRKLYTCVFSAVCGAVPAWFFTHDAILKLGVSNFETICFFACTCLLQKTQYGISWHHAIFKTWLPQSWNCLQLVFANNRLWTSKAWTRWVVFQGLASQVLKRDIFSTHVPRSWQWYQL